MPEAESHTTLVSTADVAAHLGDPRWVVVDCRYDLNETAVGERLYEEAHVPGAQYAHLGRDLSGPVTGGNGRHPLPTPDAMSATFGSLGITRDSQVVAYDHDTSMYAVRLWWMLRYLGHERVAVMDGGFSKWLREGRTTRGGRESREATRFEGAPRNDSLVLVVEMARLVSTRAARLIDARSPERYRGEVEPIDARAGHIPGAVNHHYQRNVNADGTFLPREELRRQLAATLGSRPASAAVVYCGSGVTACHLLLALEHAGLGEARLYAGSWSEWSSDAARPAASGEESGDERKG